MTTMSKFDRKAKNAGPAATLTSAVKGIRMQVFPDSGTPRWASYSGVATEQVPAHVPVYGFNLAGYATSPMKAGRGNRHEFGGLNDATFTMLSLLESRTSAGWPF